MRKNKSLIREYWVLKKILRLVTLSVLSISGCAVLLIPELGLGFSWCIVPCMISLMLSCVFINDKYTDSQAEKLYKFSYRFNGGSKLTRRILLNISTAAVLCFLVLISRKIGYLDGLQKIPSFSSFALFLFAGLIAHPYIRSESLDNGNNGIWSKNNDFNPSLDSDFPESSFNDGMSDSYDSNSQINPGNPASMLNINHSLNPSSI